MNSPAAGPRIPPARRRAREWLALGTALLLLTWGTAIPQWQAPSDFIEFYVLGDVARAGAFEALRSDEAFFAWQRRRLPETASVPYPSVYPPQMALAMQPFAALAFSEARWLNLALSVTVCTGVALWMAAGRPRLRRWLWHTGLFTVGSPLVWGLVVQGQVAWIGLLALTGAWAALRRGWRLAAGAALGMLAYKAPLVVPALAVLVAAGDWVVASAAIAAAAAQYLLAIPWTGADAVIDYLTRLAGLAAAPDRLAERQAFMHSWRTFWRLLLPAPAATAMYAASAVATTVAAGWAWRRLDDPLARIAVLGAAIVLASPHLFLYDLVLLVPLAVASADVVLDAASRRAFGLLAAAGCTAPMWALVVGLADVSATAPVVSLWTYAYARLALGRAPRRPAAQYV